jgi:hypothetical protein
LLLALAAVVAAVAIDLVLVITLLAVGRLGIAVTTDGFLAGLGAAVGVIGVTVVTLLTGTDISDPVTAEVLSHNLPALAGL